MVRPFCTTCLKAQALCVCADVPRLGNRTGVHLLQHVRERGHPLGTARLAQLGLGADVHVLYSRGEAGRSPAVGLPEGAVLLYPSDTAIALDPSDPPAHLVVVDGTWAQAHQLHRDNDWIQALPHVQLSPSAPSRYRIRREPRLDYVSTLEALVEALAVVEPDLAGLDDLLVAFDRMIDRHLAHRGSAGGGARAKRARKGRSRTVPWGVVDAPERVVLVHVEPGALGEPRPLMQVAAVRGDGAVLDVRVDSGCDADLLSLAEIVGGEPAVPVARALASLSAFCEGASAVLVWRPSQLRWLREAGVDVADWQVLSAVWRNKTGQDLPDADANPDAVVPGVRGRAAQRLGRGQWALERLRAG